MYDDLDFSSKWTNYGEIASVVNEIGSNQRPNLFGTKPFRGIFIFDKSSNCNFIIKNNTYERE